MVLFQGLQEVVQKGLEVSLTSVGALWWLRRGGRLSTSDIARWKQFVNLPKPGGVLF